MPPVLPLAATAAPQSQVADDARRASRPPTQSTAPAQRCLPSGRDSSPTTSSRSTISAAPSPRSKSCGVALAGGGNHLVAALREHVDRGAAHAPGGTGHQDRSVARLQSPRASSRCTLSAAVKPGGAQHHRVTQRQALRQRHNPVGRHTRVLGEPPVVRHAQVVAVDDHLVADGDVLGASLATTSPDRSTPGISGSIRATLLFGWVARPSL